jgi:hypothetical protein
MARPSAKQIRPSPPLTDPLPITRPALCRVFLCASLLQMLLNCKTQAARLENENRSHQAPENENRSQLAGPFPAVACG